jgi:predicted nicotinamide N-methyase
MTPAAPSRELLALWAPLRAADGRPDLLVHSAPDLFALWSAWETEAGARCAPPFWAIVWPAASALAQYLGTGAVPLEGRSVLDLGCGAALAALAAKKAGATEVTASDIDPVALRVAHANAEANGIELSFEERDLAQADRWRPRDVVLVADLFYERQAARALWPRLLAAKRDGATVLLADAGRPFFSCAGASLVQERQITVDAAVEGTSSRLARVYAL